MAPAESASISAGPALKTCVLSLVVPSASCKNPFCSPAIAGAWVTLAKYPRRSCEAGALEEEAAVGELHPVRTVTRAAVIIVVSPMERIRRGMMRAPLGGGLGEGWGGGGGVGWGVVRRGGEGGCVVSAVAVGLIDGVRPVRYQIVKVVAGVDSPSRSRGFVTIPSTTDAPHSPS